jgi:hypothetical protein
MKKKSRGEKLLDQFEKGYEKGIITLSFALYGA